MVLEPTETGLLIGLEDVLVKVLGIYIRVQGGVVSEEKLLFQIYT